MSSREVDKPKRRTAIDVSTDAGAAALYGSILGLESIEFGGDMSLTGMTLDKAINMFLSDVAREGGDAAAAVYAARLMDTLTQFLPRNATWPGKRS